MLLPFRYVVYFKLIHLHVNLNQVFTEEVPFAHLRDGGVLMEVVVKRRMPPRPLTGSLAIQRGLDEQTWEIMQACWEADPAARPTIDEIIGILSSLAVEIDSEERRDSLCCFMERVDILAVPRPVVILESVKAKRSHKSPR